MSWPDQKYLDYPFLKTRNIQPQNGLGTNGIAIGKDAGYTNQGTNGIAIGINAGYTNQGSNSIAIGNNAGYTNQGSNSIAIGNNAGYTDQSANSIAIGVNAGLNSQKENSIAIGLFAGQTSQGAGAVALGIQAGLLNQQANSVAIGVAAGAFTQGTGAVAIGVNAGQYSQGANAIAIGSQAGYTNQAAGSIVLNASGAWNSDITYRTTAGTFIRPIRGASGNAAVSYNTTTFELTYNTSSATTKNTIEDLTIDTSIVHNLKPKTYIYNSDPEAGTQIGYIAEEVKMIHYNFATYNIPNGDPVAINYNVIVVFLVEELKKLKSTVDTLTQENQDFLERLIVLENK